MRLAPVALRHWRDREALLRVADLQTRTTHGSPATLAASGIFAALLADAIAGLPLPELLASQAADRIEGGWRGLHRDAVFGTGWVVQSLQAAVWAVSRTTDFRSAVLLAANLGDDADTTAAIAGQLAGAVYGMTGIPDDWLAVVAWRERLEITAERLFNAGWPAADAAENSDQCEAPWKKGDLTERERLQALASFGPVFERDGFVFAEQIPSRQKNGNTFLGGATLSEDGWRFYQSVYIYGWVQIFDWSKWRATEAGSRLMHDPTAMTRANVDELARVLTTCIRADRFCDGYLTAAFDAGLIRRVVARAGALLAESSTSTES